MNSHTISKETFNLFKQFLLYTYTTSGYGCGIYNELVFVAKVKAKLKQTAEES